MSAVALLDAREVAAQVTDPELPMLTLVDLGVLREVDLDETGTVVVDLAPTYSGCPAMATMRDDLERALLRAGYAEVHVRVSLSPAWSSEWISEAGREALRAHGLSAPGPVERAEAGAPVALTLLHTRRALCCPRCGSSATELVSEFGATACKAMYRCTACAEPFEHVKEI